MYCYVICYMGSSPLHICGCGFHLQWSYNLCYTRVDDDADASGDAMLWGARGEDLGCFI